MRFVMSLLGLALAGFVGGLGFWYAAKFAGGRRGA